MDNIEKINNMPIMFNGIDIKPIITEDTEYYILCNVMSLEILQDDKGREYLHPIQIYKSKGKVLKNIQLLTGEDVSFHHIKQAFKKNKVIDLYDRYYILIPSDIRNINSINTFMELKEKGYI
ncbi:hypothetical protein [Romboutsia lituseburensis]|uniref:hypothetical protein n=1 Tax=Romboutsia lituseburensis TaxID=1537 RepID=UPI00215B680F|nr:hypothetical protein [Romboutsia lituseburensis]MCR8745237.1 hypothetical protein [Romboutsia lituseburensis]